jgi:hypothetical protein
VVANVLDGLLDGIQQRILLDQVTDGVSRKPQLGEDGDGDASLAAGPRSLEDGIRIGRWIGQDTPRRTGRNACKPVLIDGTEVHDLVSGVSLHGWHA